MLYRLASLCNSFLCPKHGYLPWNNSQQPPTYLCSRLPTTNQSSPRTVSSHLQLSRRQDTGRQTEATTIHTPQPYECFAASRITSFLPMASPPWNLMSGESHLCSPHFHYSTQRQTTHADRGNETLRGLAPSDTHPCNNPSTPFLCVTIHQDAEACITGSGDLS